MDYIKLINDKYGDEILNFLEVKNNDELGMYDYIHSASYGKLIRTEYIGDKLWDIKLRFLEVDDYKTIEILYTLKDCIAVRVFYITNKIKYSNSIHLNFHFPVQTRYKKFIDEFLEENKYKKYNINLNKGLLLSGPPGNGKTNILKYIKKEVFQKYKDYAACINDLRMERLEDYASYKYQLFDDINMERFTAGHPSYNRILSYLDDCSFIQKTMVFTTNQKAVDLSPAIIRPGRISQILEITNPTIEEKVEILGNIENAQELAEKSGNVSCADITYMKICLIDSDFNVDKAIELFNKRKINFTKEVKINGFLGGIECKS